jgi:hypothetical protein
MLKVDISALRSPGSQQSKAAWCRACLVVYLLQGSMKAKLRLLVALVGLSAAAPTTGTTATAFTTTPTVVSSRIASQYSSPPFVVGSLHSTSSSSSSEFFFAKASASPSSRTSTSPLRPNPRRCRARDLLQSLVVDDRCYEPIPYVGITAVTTHLENRINARRRCGGRSTASNDSTVADFDIRIDSISDGDSACGFMWTWVTKDEAGRDVEEGLRGTTFVELNENTGAISYVQEMAEPLYKPGDLTKDLLKAVTAGAQSPPWKLFESRTPTVAHELARYLYVDLQGADPEQGIPELVRFLDESIVYRDFNFEQPLQGPAQVRRFVEDFSFPGITFRPTRFDDGHDRTCFTWEVVLDGVEADPIKGMSFYDLDPITRKIVYVRDVPESAIKPPPIGLLARQLRPKLGVFQGLPAGSRPGGR